MVNYLNSILIEGNLVRDPQAGETPGGVKVCLFTVATNRYYRKDGESQTETSYFMVEVWGRTAENCERFLKKGGGVRIVGRLKQDRWSDQDGRKHSRIKIVAEHVDFKNNINGGGYNKNYAGGNKPFIKKGVPAPKKKKVLEPTF